MLIIKLRQLIFFFFLVITIQGVSANDTDNMDNIIKQQPFIAGEHYIVLDKPVATRDNSKIEVVEMFTYGCPDCWTKPLSRRKKPASSQKKCNLISPYSQNRVACKLIKLTLRLRRYDTIYRNKIQPLLCAALQTFKT